MADNKIKLKDAVVIDDKEEEALPLIKALWKLGISCKYFSGKRTEMPKEPISGIRLIFLDLILDETEASMNSDDKVSKILSILNKTVGKENGLYILILWTANSTGELPDLLIKKLRLTGIKEPVVYKTLRKQDFVRNKKYDINKLNKVIQQKVKELKQTKLLLVWEYLAGEAEAKTINNFMNEIKDEAQPDKQLSDMFYRLGSAYAEKSNYPNSRRAANALLAFNSVFTDTLEKDIRDRNFLGTSEIVKSAQNNANTITAIATFNEKLILFKDGKSKLSTGNVYEAKGALKNNRIRWREHFEGKKRPDKVKNICLEISPSCDYAQGKIRKSRMLPGILFKYADTEVYEPARKDYSYISPIIKFDNKIARMVFDFRYFYSANLKEVKKAEPIFTLRNEMIVDIQSRLASHINRPGVTSIGHKQR